MFKRFMIGFTLGFGLMYWWIYQSDGTVAEAERLMQRSASEYRGDAHRRMADEALGVK